MNDPVDCLVFEDQLDAWMRGELPDEGVTQLQAHAAGCRACSTLARVGEGLSGPSLAELEAMVPDAWVDAMGERVEAALRERGATRPGRRSWVVPTLAAASVALLFTSGLAFRALGRAAVREEVLAEQVLDQQRRLTEQGASAADPTRRGSVVAGRAASLRSLGREGWQGPLTVADLRALLDELPAATPVIRAANARALSGSRLIPATWREALAGLDTGRDVTAGDLLGVLDGLELPGATTVPAGRILELLS
jgi:hypothetical protein